MTQEELNNALFEAVESGNAATKLEWRNFQYQQRHNATTIHSLANFYSV